MGFKDVRDKYEQITSELFGNKSKFAEFLEFSGKFYKQSTAQAMAVFTEKPDARMVADYETWKDFKRQVKRGEKGIPYLSDGKVLHCFEISQTAGETEPFQWRLDKYTAEKFRDKFASEHDGNFTSVAQCVNFAAVEEVEAKINGIVDALNISKNDQATFLKSARSMVRQIMVSRCEYQGAYKLKTAPLDLSAVDMLHSRAEFEKLCEWVQLTARSALRKIEITMKQIIAERSFENERDEQIARNDYGEQQNVQARSENGNVPGGADGELQRGGAEAPGNSDRGVRQGMAEVYGGELPVRDSAPGDESAVRTDRAEGGQRSGEPLQHSNGELVGSSSTASFDVHRNSGVGENEDNGVQTASNGGRGSEAPRDLNENADTLYHKNEQTAEEKSSAVSSLAAEIAELSDKFTKKYNSDYRQFSLANFAFENGGTEYDLNKSVQENIEKILSGDNSFLREYLNAVYNEAFEGRIIVEEGEAAKKLLGRLSALEHTATEIATETEDGQLSFFNSEPQASKNDAIIKEAEHVISPADKKVITATRVGDFFEFYGEAAKELSAKYNLTLTTRNGEPMVGISERGFEDFCGELYDDGIIVENWEHYQNVIKPRVAKSPSRERAEELINDYYERELDDVGDFRNPVRVDLAYTEDEETGLPIQVYADLENFRIVTIFNDVVVDEDKYNSLAEMNETVLKSLNFDDLVYLPEEMRVKAIGKSAENKTEKQPPEPDRGEEDYDAQSESVYAAVKPLVEKPEVFFDEDKLENVSPVTQSSANLISDFREKTDEYYNKLAGYSAHDAEELVKYFIRGAFRENEISAEVGEVVLYGSRCRGMESDSSDIDFVVEIYSDVLKEDALFNILHETPFEIGGVPVDINPIRPEESGSIEDYLVRAEQYLQEKEAKEITAPEAQDYRAEETEPTSFGQKARYAANVAAIKTLQQIERENRHATPDEQKILAQYVGWGGIPQVFDGENASWTKEYAELKELLTPDEYEAARGSVLNAHYTSQTVINAMYKALDNFGFKSGNVLEPSMGVGKFFGSMPENLREKSSLFGVELDSITGRIAKQLYPNANVQITGFEKTDFPDNFFDVAIGNVPFGSYGVADKRYDKEKFLIHDYFFAKTLDKVAPGGIIAFVTSKGTLDKVNSKAREYIAKRADLIGAIRLPNNAFKATANTEVTSDIIFLQKREKMTVEIPDWVYTAKNSDGITVNQYFLDHPEMMLGTMSEDGKMYGGTNTTCVPIEGADLSEQLDIAVANLKASIAAKKVDAERQKTRGEIPATSDVRNFTHTIIDGKMYFRENNIMYEVEEKGAKLARMKGLHELRNTLRALITAQENRCSDEQLQAYQEVLNEQYDAFEKKYGNINSSYNSSLFSSDDDYNILCALENYDPETQVYSKSDIFSKRTIKAVTEITRVDTPQEALQASLDLKGRVDVTYMSQLCGESPEKVTETLLGEGMIFRNPEKHDPEDAYSGFEEASEYLSGNIREKLRAAQKAAAESPDFQRNVAALKQVLPEKISAAEITARIGVNWVDIDDYKRFMLEYAKADRIAMNTLHRTYSGEYKIEGKRANKGVAATSSFGTTRLTSIEIFERLLNNRDVIVKDRHEDVNGKVYYTVNTKETQLAQNKALAMKEAFARWLWEEPARREKYETRYNELFNSLVGREYDGSHQTFPGMSPFIKLNPHQLNAVQRAKLGGNTLLAHCVGAGKSFEMIAATMEKKRLGLINKACVVVPKALVRQMANEWLRLYPDAKILVAGEKDFTEKNRKKFIGRCCTGDYAAVIMSQEQFERIPMSLEYRKSFVQRELELINSGIAEGKAAGSRGTVKELERAKKKVEAKITKLLDAKAKDEALTFEQLGFDSLVVDEAHGYKNGLVVTKMSNVAGVQTTPAQKSEDILMKTQYLNEQSDCKNIIFATGTPVSNSMVEMYTMQRYLRPDLLEKAGLENFDDWASTFGEVVTQLEQTPDGQSFRPKKRFAKFANLPELMVMYKEFADIRTPEMIKLPVPDIKGGKAETILAKPSDFQEAYVQELAARSELIHSGSVDPHDDNMLKITHEARLLGLDARCINPNAENDPTSKVNLCIDKIMEIYNRTSEQKGVQAVFCDIAVNDTNSEGERVFSVYNYIREELARRGIPPEEICAAGDADTDARRAQMMSELNSGAKRIVLASTSKMGTGANFQQKLCALHHLDIPWKPSDLEQRNGRIQRQGNENKEVEIYHYLTEKTFDSYMMSIIVNKQKFISQIMSGKTPARTCQDVDEMVLNYSEMQAIASGDPRIKEKIELDGDVARLRMLESEFKSSKFEMEANVGRYEKEIKRLTEIAIPRGKSDIEFAKNHELPPDTFEVKICGKIYTERKEAGTALRKQMIEVLKERQSKEVGEYRGFKISLSMDIGYSPKITLTRDGGLSYYADTNLDTDIGNISRLENLVSEGLEKRLNSLLKELEEAKENLDAAKKNLATPFEHAAELSEKTARLEQLDRELNIDKADEVIIANEEDEEHNEDRDRGEELPPKKPKPTKH